MIVVSSSSSAARPFADVALKWLVAAAAALNAEQSEDSPAVLMADDGHNDGVEDGVDGEHVETEVRQDVEAVGIDELVVGQ